ncbi:hypothetical protein E2C01_031929 [Portunus trituberculatus]|uniref:Uncharacterized protein n=1 Tax=Portunus trituberculatus TaxID=210409 RepID=A0A5B7EZZ2_PORTR|nr:hypothetical protein [Portunus trituberculatus]
MERELRWESEELGELEGLLEGLVLTEDLLLEFLLLAEDLEKGRKNDKEELVEVKERCVTN